MVRTREIDEPAFFAATPLLRRWHERIAGTLYFTNADWLDDWEGGTIFYDLAGVPSRKRFEARLSVAFEFAAR